MYSFPMMFPLDLDGELHSIQDENGNTVGTGSRQVCEVLLHLMTKSMAPANDVLQGAQVANVRSAISI